MHSMSSAAERFIHTNVLARQSIQREEGGSKRNSLCLIAMLLTIMLCFFIFLWVRIYILETGYRISSTLKQHERLLQENRELRIERASLRSPSRIENIAKSKLGMVEPDNSQVVIIPW
jgi:cell division protein FtsL